MSHETKRGNTVYRVFAASDQEASSLTFVGETGAVSDKKAVEAVIVDGVEAGALYVAIPVRYLRVRPVTVENRPRVVVG